MNNYSNQIEQLFAAEIQFRLASAVRLAVTLEKQPLDLPVKWTYGKHTVQYNEVALRKDQATYASTYLHRSATFLMAVAIKDVIKSIIHNPKNHSDANIRNTYQIARLIRNAFTHGPFHPTWSIDPDCQNVIFEVKDIIALNTKGLQGTPFDWRHYGGPLALLKLCQFVRFEILKDTSTRPLDRKIPKPKTVCYQQGDLILEEIKKLPSRFRRKNHGKI